MCTPEEAKLFIKAVESLKGKPVNLFDWDMYPDNRMLYPMNLDEYLVPEMETEFPVKDRSISRKRHHASKRDKAKHFESEMNAFIRDWKLYNSGFNFKKGKSRNQFRLESETEKNIREFFRLEKEWSPNEEIDSVIYRDEMESLKEKGIYVFSETLEREIEERERNLYVYERKEDIDFQMEIIGYEVFHNDFYEGILTDMFCRTEEEANNASSILQDKYKEEYYVHPIRAYTEEQKREIEELGFEPIPHHFIKRKKAD